MAMSSVPEFVPEAGQDDPVQAMMVDVASRRHQVFPVLTAAEHGPGEFTAEAAQLSGRPALVNGHAVGNVEVLVLTSESLRALVVAEAELGERIVRALILRRVGLLEFNSGSPVLVGPRGNGNMHHLQSFLSSNGHPHTVLDPAGDACAAALVARHQPRPGEWPLVVCPDGSVKKKPSNVELGRCLGLLPDLNDGKVFDVLVVGAGPAGLATFEGRGVYYWASPIQAKLCKEQEVLLVGGGNSAGQAAVFLSGHAARVHVVIRGPGLAASMSSYLIERIAATPNIVLHTHTELVALEGDEDGLASVRWRDNRSGAQQECAVRQVFLFVGADPNTDWLAGCGVGVDEHGFVRTGFDVTRAQCRAQGHPGHPPDEAAPRAALETSVPGVFAIGDVRAGSTKRVAAAVSQIHAFLARPPLPV
jgi:thioredoxin reductase